MKERKNYEEGKEHLTCGLGKSEAEKATAAQIIGLQNDMRIVMDEVGRIQKEFYPILEKLREVFSFNPPDSITKPRKH